MWALFLFFALHATLAAEVTALYLSWYGDPTTTMAIQWHTQLSEHSDGVEIQELGGPWRSETGSHLELGDRLVHKLLLEDLTPDTEYAFRLDGDPSLFKFRTAPKDLTHPCRFCIGGDLYHTPGLFRKMCRAVATKNPLFIVIGGDIAYALGSLPLRLHSTAIKQWSSFLKEWKEEMITKEGRVIPFLIVPGNHDLKPECSELFFNLFAFPAKRLYRAVDFGAYLSLILLDTGHFEPIVGAQTEWLEEALEERQNVPLAFAVYHIAAYPSVYFTLSGDAPELIRTHWCPLFDRYNLSAAFEHHNHAYKRTVPIRGNKADATGVVYLGDGCWGATPRWSHDAWYLAKHQKINNVYMIEISEKAANIEAVDLHGERIDGLTIPARKFSTTRS
jgi:Calcineurin-like phosphoesterase/Purple acid Phosphatase, N-terminal domain